KSSFFQAEDGIRDFHVTGVHTCALPIFAPHNADNKRIAKFIQAELVRNLENTDREAKIINNVFLMKNAEKTGPLVEIGFLSNPRSEERRVGKERRAQW